MGWRFLQKKKLYLGFGFITFVFFLQAPSQSLFAVLQAEGGKAVMHSEPAQEKKTEPKEKQSMVTLTSRVPKAVRAFAKDNSLTTTSQNVATASVATQTTSVKTATSASTTASTSSTAVKPVSPPVAASAVTPSAGALSSTPATTQPSVASDSLGCILAGTLRKDLMAAECKAKGGRVIMPPVSNSAAAASAPATAPSAPPSPNPAPAAAPAGPATPANSKKS